MLPIFCAQFPHWKNVSTFVLVENLSDKVGRVHSLWNCMLDINVGKKDTTSMQITKKRKERECSQESLLANREFQVQCTKPRKSGEQTKFMKTIIMIQKLFHKLLECGNTGVLQDVSTVS